MPPAVAIRREVFLLTEHEIEAVDRLIGYGLDYKQIGEVTGIDKEILRSYTRRHPAVHVTLVDTDGYCRSCGRPVSFTPGHRIRFFCGNQCRRTFWNSHRDQIRHRTWRAFTCLYCGSAFKGRRDHKYCCRECYFLSRRKENHG